MPGCFLPSLKACLNGLARTELFTGDMALLPPASVDLRILDRARACQEVEVAAIVGLHNVFAEHGAVASSVMRRRWLPRTTTACDLRVVHQQVEARALGIEAHQVAITNQRDRPANTAFRARVQHAGAI